MLFAAVNPADLLSIDGRYAGFGEASLVLGAEGVGMIEEVGQDLSPDLVGSRVIPMSRGNWTTHRLLRAGEFIRLPATLQDSQAAFLRINPATAARLIEGLALSRGDCLVRNVSRSSVVRWIDILAGTAGIRAEDVADMADGAADGALDALAGAATGELAAKLRPGGRLIVYGHISGQPCTIPSTLLTGRDLTIRGFSLRRAEVDRDMDDLQTFYDRLAKLLEAHPEPVDSVHDLGAVDMTLHAARRRGRNGRVLLALRD